MHLKVILFSAAIFYFIIFQIDDYKANARVRLRVLLPDSFAYLPVGPGPEGYMKLTKTTLSLT